MSSRAEELAAKLKEKQAKEDDGKGRLQALVDQWPLDVTEVFINLEAWAGPLLEAGLDVSRSQQTARETPPGHSFTYTIPHLSFRHGAHSLTFSPIGRFMIGSSGAIDVKGVKGSDVSLLRMNNQGNEGWVIWTAANARGQRAEPVALTEDSFLSLIEKAFNL